MAVVDGGVYGGAVEVSRKVTEEGNPLYSTYILYTVEWAKLGKHKAREI